MNSLFLKYLLSTSMCGSIIFKLQNIPVKISPLLLKCDSLLSVEITYTIWDGVFLLFFFKEKRRSWAAIWSRWGWSSFLCQKKSTEACNEEISQIHHLHCSIATYNLLSATASGMTITAHVGKWSKLQTAALRDGLCVRKVIYRKHISLMRGKCTALKPLVGLNFLATKLCVCVWWSGWWMLLKPRMQQSHRGPADKAV